jgi:hypothetical protein
MRLDATAAIAAVALVVAAAARGLLLLLVAAGVIVFAVGLRIAYDLRGAGTRYLAGPLGRQLPFLSLAPEWKRVIDGTVIAALGVVLAGIGLIWTFR